MREGLCEKMEEWNAGRMEYWVWLVFFDRLMSSMMNCRIQKKE
jgi:hypothetical protein